MDSEKLIERLRTESLYADKASLEIMDLCMEAADALSTFQAENEKLRNEVERQRRSADDRKHLYENAERAYMKVVAELERVKVERDAYQVYFKDLSSKPDCNTCEKRNCDYRPKIGATVRVNCPLYSGPEKDD